MKKNKRAFTVVELVIVIAVIGVLAAILIPTLVNLSDKASNASLQSDLTNSYKMYYVDAMDGYIGDADKLTTAQKKNLELKNVEEAYAFLSEDQNPTIAKLKAYSFKDRKWEETDVVSLNSVCVSRPNDAAKYGKYYVFYGEAKPDAIAINPASFGLPIGASMGLDVITTPKSASTEKIKWESNNPAVATIDEYGIATSVSAGSTYITAWYDDNGNDVRDDGEIYSTSAVIVSAIAVEENQVSSVEPPKFVASYDTNTKNLSSYNSLSRRGSRGVARANSTRSYRNTYFKNEEGDRDIYKVGVRNSFEFNCSAGLDTGSLTEAGAYVANTAGLGNDLDVKELVNGVPTTTSKAHTSGNSVIFTYNEFLTGEGGTFENAKFRLTKTINGHTVTFDFEAFDAYNIYDAAGLSLFDNMDSWVDKMYFNYKNKTNIAEDLYASKRGGISSDDVKGLALHADIYLTNDDVPAELKYSEEQINAYISRDSANFNAWVRAYNAYYRSIYGRDYSFEFDGREELIGSLKDDRSIFYRSTTTDDNFVFEGNYFTIDASQIKPVYSTNTNNSSDLIILEDDSANAAESLIDSFNKEESHVSLFGWNLVNNEPRIVTQTSNSLASRGGENFIRNLTVRGNGDLDNDKKHAGGLIIFKGSATTVNLQNIICSNTYTTFMNDLNYSICSAKKDEVSGHPELSSAHDGTFNLDRVKSFRSYNIMYYAGGAKYNNISNSYFEDAGGPLILLDERNYGYVAHKGSVGFIGSEELRINNSHLQNYVQGSESWFVTHGANTLLEMVSNTGGKTGWLGKNAAEHGQHKNIVSYFDKEELIPMLNFLIVDFTGAGASIGNNQQKGGQPLEGKTYIDGQTICNMEDVYGSNANIAPYSCNASLLLNSPSGMIFNSSAGGHGMVANAYGTDGVSFIPDYGTTVLPYFTGDQTVYNMDSVLGPIYHVDTNPALTTANNLASGNYMTLYLKTLHPLPNYQPDSSNYSTLYYSGVVLGME